MIDHYILDAQRNPVRCSDIIQWAQWFRQNDRVVAHTSSGDVMISTIFLGLDHGWGDKVLLYETMVFNGPWDEYCERYETEAEARKGHERALKAVLHEQRWWKRLIRVWHRFRGRCHCGPG